jgi:hypothetical protein
VNRKSEVLSRLNRILKGKEGLFLKVADFRNQEFSLDKFFKRDKQVTKTINWYPCGPFSEVLIKKVQD